MRISGPCRHSVALVGMDGSGKSTQAALLSATLRSQGKRVLVIHPFGRKLLAFLPDRLTAHASGSATQLASAPGAIPQRSRPVGRSKRLSAVIELLDVGAYVWIAYVRTFFISELGRQEVWLVEDRSFDDLLIKHRRRRTLSTRTLSLARRLAPCPEKTVWLQTQPSVALARDGEFHPSYYEELYAEYALGAGEYGWEVVRTAGLSPKQVEAEVKNVLRLAAQPADGIGMGWNGFRAAANEIPSETQATEARQT